MAAIYRPSARWPLLHGTTAAALAIAALQGHWAFASACLLGSAFCARRAFLHAQEIELTPTALICRSPFGENRLSYRHIASIRFSHGDLLLERPAAHVRIPRRYAGCDEIRRAVSLAVWAHRGGDVPPDLAESGSAFG